MMSSIQVLKKVIPVDDAVSVLQDGDVLATSGYGGHGMPERLLVALEKRFVDTGAPKGLTLMHATGQRRCQDKGLNLLARRAAASRDRLLWPDAEDRAAGTGQQGAGLESEGVITHMYRDIGAGKPGTLSRLAGTFVDPRLEGGKMNRITVDDIVELMTVGGKEYLFYKTLPINVAFIRGTTADPDGNITMEKEALVLETLALAIAARNSHGYVICQVERIALEGSLDSRQVRLPGVLVDAWSSRGRSTTCRRTAPRTTPPIPANCASR
jgi:propionate CoA-transferase